MSAFGDLGEATGRVLGGIIALVAVAFGALWLLGEILGFLAIALKILTLVVLAGAALAAVGAAGYGVHRLVVRRGGWRRLGRRLAKALKRAFQDD